MSVICKKKRMELVEFLQNFIYLMNDTQIRNKVIRNCLKQKNLKSHKWLGTIVLSGEVNKLNVDKVNDKNVNKPLKKYCPNLPDEYRVQYSIGNI